MTPNVIAVSVASFPVRLTSFVGRVAELRSVTEELGRHRLVSLVGPGGSGKTRLALQAARICDSGARWFVDLAPVEPDGVDAALAAATDAPEGPGEAPLDATIRRIGDAPALLLVDNCDQVVADSARVVDVLLRDCPGLTVLATSREPLRVEGEHVWRVPPLSLPDCEQALDGDAVLLFLDRAGLSPDAATRDLAQVHEICRHLDGIPLAIELAASRAKVLPMVDVLAGLSDRFRLLTGGPRTADTRQQTLAESIAWSYRLLSDDERTVLQRLAVFRASFTASGARAVATGGDIAELDVLPLLAGLVEKSFVVVDEGSSLSRYRLLETIREYAGGQLGADSADAHATRDRHLRYLRDAAERFEPALERDAAPESFEADFADVRAAVGWAAENGNADDGLRLVGALGDLWYCRARGEDRRIIDTALAIDGGENRWRAKALAAAAAVAIAALDPQAIGFGRQAVQLADESYDPGITVQALTILGWCYLYMDLAQARPYLLRACELARATDDRAGLADALAALANTEWADLPTARAVGEEALAIATAGGYQIAACHAHAQLFLIHLMQGRPAELMRSGSACCALAERLGERLVVVFSRGQLTYAATLQGDIKAAAGHSDAAIKLAKAIANPLATGFAAAYSGFVGLVSGDVARARTALAEGLPVMSVIFGGVGAPWFAELLADADLLAGDLAAAREHTAQAAALAEHADVDWGRSRAAIAQCRLDLHDGEVQAAAEAAHRALALAEATENAITMIDALELLARIGARRGGDELATRLLSSAAAERARIGFARFLVHTATHETLVDELKARLGPDEFAKSWAEGERLPIADAVALARSRRGSRGRPALGWDALTPAELRVVGLVGEGLNNVQIAERLFVTRDTVKGHVASAFRKLGVTNRTELAAEAVRRQTDPQRR